MRIHSSASKIAVILAAAVLPACASPVENVDVEADLPSDIVDIQQIPVDTSKPTGLQFMHNQLPFIQVLATGDAVGRGSAFGPRTEYWTGSRSVFATNLTSLQMVTAEVRESDPAMTAFLYPNASFGEALTAPQVVTKADWTEGVYRADSLRARLFKAPDPDDPSHSIGFLVEQDARGRLVGTTWYKTGVETGRIFERTPDELTFSAVLDDNDRPTTDPNFIERGAAWFHYTARAAR